ncbi:hypothetical protein E2C01_063854 [Portunus trituberculatus]|uniref:Uncharacterized protein n=1 Tax=Portunus trituberculatus TaxID=210409 RepID=A0A5B7HM77_PORTR|nr:hypothetical protein [Portunus trituberculatus]
MKTQCMVNGFSHRGTCRTAQPFASCGE